MTRDAADRLLILEGVPGTDPVEVLIADNLATNGVVHTVNNVLTPPKATSVVLAELGRNNPDNPDNPLLNLITL